ncbi:MAG: 50S ribosomal protein L32e [Promethearchaeota archaeon]
MEQKRLLELRKRLNKSRPKFRRVESWRYKRVKESWRKARGIDSKTRKKLKSGVKSPSVGYRNPKKVRGLHPSGYQEVLVHTLDDIKKLNKKNHAIRISGKIGAKKRLSMIEYAQSRGFKVLNIGSTQRELEKFESMLESSMEEKEELSEIEDLED